MNYSVTERGTFRRCERAWRLTSKGGMHLGPIVAPVYLTTGTLIHTASQHWLVNDPSGFTYSEHVLMAADVLIEKAKAKYLTQVGAPMGTTEEQVLIDSAHFAHEMAVNYEVRWGSALPEGMRIIRPEQRAVIPVPGTEHECEACAPSDIMMGGPTGRIVVNGEVVDCPECDGTGTQLHYLDMRFDGLVQDARDRVYVLEHKTYDARPKLESLAHNDQFLAYMWGARQLGIGQVVGLAYDGLWRRDKVPRGRTFEDLFLRAVLMRPEAEFEEFERLLPWELNEMYSKRPTERPLNTLPINRQWQGCFDCKMDPLCAAISRNENTEVILRTQYTERDDDVSDAEAGAGLVAEA